MNRRNRPMPTATTAATADDGDYDRFNVTAVAIGDVVHEDVILMKVDVEVRAVGAVWVVWGSAQFLGPAASAK